MKLFCAFIFLIAFSVKVFAQPVKYVGAMRNTMWKGQLAGLIDLDSLATDSHMIGLGPSSFLNGELLLLNGKIWKSTVGTNGQPTIHQVSNAQAPFLVYAQVEQWVKITMPDSVTNLLQLENYLNNVTSKTNEPFAFRLEGPIQSASYHIVNLPAGATVSNPTEAHQGLKSFDFSQLEGTVIGFFSKRHQAIFTHHDTFIHAHIISQNKQHMGHLESITFDPKQVVLLLSL